MRPRMSAYSTSAWPSSRSRRACRLMKKLFIATICYLPPVRISGPGCVAAARPLFRAWAPAQNLHSLLRAQQDWLVSPPTLTSPSSGSSFEQYRARNQAGTADRLGGTELSGESRAAFFCASPAEDDHVAPVELAPPAARDQPLRDLLLARRVEH